MAAAPSSPAYLLAAPITPRPEIRLVVFDFDGTLSWLRHGWPEMMSGVFQEYLPAGWVDRPEEEIESQLLDEILALNGQPSVKQCQRFVELCYEAGGPRWSAEKLRGQFQERLDFAITDRIASVKSGTSEAAHYIIAGAHAFLQTVREAGLTPAILSTTVQERVEQEAALLGIREFFGHHIYGGTGDATKFSKRAIFERLLQEEGIRGDQLLSFGDGPVEIRDTKELGGLAVGVCSDEANNGSGLLDPRKHRQLLEAGADAVVPDYRDAAALLKLLLGR